MNLVRSFNKSLETRPLMTKVLQSGTITALGDVICQNFERCKVIILKIQTDSNKNKPYDYKRTRTFFFLGSLFIAPFLHFNYTYTLPYIAGLGPGTTSTLATCLKKLIFDQTVLASSFFVMFYHAVNRLDGHSASHAQE